MKHQITFEKSSLTTPSGQEFWSIPISLNSSALIEHLRNCESICLEIDIPEPEKTITKKDLMKAIDDIHYGDIQSREEKKEALWSRL